MKKAYRLPFALRVVGLLRDLTPTVPKNSNNNVDGFSFHGTTLTS